MAMASIFTKIINGEIEIDYIFDPNYTWNSGDPTTSGGILNFKGEAFLFSRTAATNLKPAVWVRK